MKSNVSKESQGADRMTNNNHTIKFELKSDGDSLLGLLNEEYSVNVIVVDDSAIELNDKDTVLVQTGVSKIIYNTDNNPEYLFVENVQIYDSVEGSEEISTTALSMINSTQNHSNNTRYEPPKGQNASTSERIERNKLERCAECGKVVESDVLTQGVCRYCRIERQVESNTS